jgi:hypothetical protein
MKGLKLIGLIVLVAGVVVLVVGIVQLVQFNTSGIGKLSNSLAGAFGTHSRGIEQPIIMIAIGVVAAAVGCVVYKKG